MSLTTRVELVGVLAASQRLRRCADPKTARKIERRAVARGSSILAKSVKAVTPVRSGGKKLLRKSIGTRVKVYKGSAVGIVGPRTKMKAQIGVVKRGGKKSKPGDPIFENPSAIAHLVNKGHGGPHPAGPTNFMARGLDAGKGPATDAMIDLMRQGIEDAAT